MFDLRDGSIDPALRWLAALSTGGVLNLLAVRVGAGASGLVRGGAVVVAAGTLAIPFFVDASPFFLLLMAHVLALNALRATEILAGSATFTPRERVARVLFPFETRLMKRVPRRFAGRLFATSTLRLVAGTAALVAALRIAGPTTPYDLAGWPRWCLAGLGTYIVFDGATDHMTALLAALGWEHPPINRSPIRARTLAEFWGLRWNSVVGYGFRVNVFAPLARRRLPRVGLFASFAASAALHMYFFLAAVGPKTSMWLGAFFVAQGALVLFESRIGLRRLRPALGHAFVVASFAVTLPLFAEPALRALVF